MRFSQLFGKTTKTLPADAKIASHKLLYKAGFIRQFLLEDGFSYRWE